jgi:hypothetical protein
LPLALTVTFPLCAVAVVGAELVPELPELEGGAVSPLPPDDPPPPDEAQPVAGSASAPQQSTVIRA